MSFNLREKSPYSGEPVELLEYKYNDGTENTIYTTTADRDVVIGGNTYTAIYSKRDPITINGDPDASNNQINIEMPKGSALTNVLLGSDLPSGMTVKIFTVHMNDPDMEKRQIFNGSVVGWSIQHPNIVVGIESFSKGLERMAMTSRIQRGCRHVLYRPGCFVSKSNFEVSVSVIAVNNKNVTVSDHGKPDGWFAGGIIQIGGMQRFIVRHIGNTMTVSDAMVSLTAGAKAKLYAGCDRSSSTCLNKFDNLLNYGGVDFMPGVSAFEGNPIA